MQSIHSAGFDPVFYMHHAFVDYVWELFRRRQFRRCGVDPAYDYPDLTHGDSHAAGARMIGFDWLTNRDGIKYDWVDSWYDYESTPSCPNCCEGCAFPAPVYCDRIRNVCVGRSRRSFAFGPFDDRTRRTAHLEPREIYTINQKMAPRNRGREFQAPTSDGRTIYTAIDDTFNKMLLREQRRNNGTSGSFESRPDRPFTEFADPSRDQRRPLFDGAQSRPSDLQMAARQSNSRRVLSETGRPPSSARLSEVYRSPPVAIPIRRDHDRARLDSPTFNRPISISDAPISLTDVRTSFSSRPRPSDVAGFSNTDSRSSNRDVQRIDRPISMSDTRSTVVSNPALESRGITDVRMSSFDMPAAPASRGGTATDPLVAYASPQMSLYERPVSYQDPMVLPDRQGSIPARRREYIGSQTRTLPDSRKMLVSRTRRIQQASTVTFPGESGTRGSRDQSNTRQNTVTARRTSSGRQFLDFAGR